MKPHPDLIKVEFSKRFLAKLSNMAEHDLSKDLKYETCYRVYILQIKTLKGNGPLQFYVGSTSRAPEVRIAEHATEKGWSRFRSGLYEIAEVRSDLFEQFPEFAIRNTAERAEGLVADKRNEMGFRAYSDQEKKRVKHRKSKVVSGRD